MSLRVFVACVETKLECRKIQEQKDELRATELMMIKKYPVPQVGPFLPHPEYLAHLEECASNFRKYFLEGNTSGVWGVGDSILAQSRYDLDMIDPRMNDALGGSWAHHIQKTVQDMRLFFKAVGFIPSAIVVGTPGGNNLLNRQEVNSVIGQSIEMLDCIRTSYPNAKLVVYGLPASIVAYLIQTRPVVHEAVRAWCKANRAVFLEMEKRYVEDKHVLPAADASYDGVHLTPLGKLAFNADIKAGLNALPGSVIP